MFYKFITVVIMHGNLFQHTVIIGGYITWKFNPQAHSYVYLSKLQDIFSWYHKEPKWL